MNADERRLRMNFMHYLCSSTCICGLIFSVSFAQSTKSVGGLDSLADETLMNELAARGMTTLLDRAFEINKIPKSEQEGRRALIALRQISDKNAKLTLRQRQDLLAKVVAGIEAALPAVRDPDVLMQQGQVLV